MDDLWQQFHRLPKAIRDAVSRPEALVAVDRLEQQYPNLDLASFVMRVVVKEFSVNDIPTRLVEEFHLSQDAAEAVTEELNQTVFVGLQDYIGPIQKASAAPVEAIIRPVPPRPPANLPVADIPVPAPAPTELPKVPITPVKLLPIIPLSPSGQLPPAPPIPSGPPMPLTPPSLVPPAPLVSPMTPPRPVPPPMASVMTPPPPATPRTFTVPAAPIGAIAPTQEYSDEDAQEIAQQARRLQALATPAISSLDEIAQGIINQHHLAFHDELLAKRAVAILKARLKNIRNGEETTVMLVRAPKVGGLGLDQDIAKQVVASLETQAKTAKERGMVRPPEIIGPPPPPAIPPLQAQQPIAKPPLYRDAVSATARPAVLAGAPITEPPAAMITPAIQRPADIPTPPAWPTTPPPITPKPVSPPVVRRERMIDRPAIVDITRPSKTLGPADEMRTLTLMEFRRLGQGANESTARLLAKFVELQRESFTMWAEALSGWRHSEVYQLYLDMGRQSLEQATSISDVIKQRAAANELYLSEHEFTALADFNRQLQS